MRVFSFQGVAKLQTLRERRRRVLSVEDRSRTHGVHPVIRPQQNARRVRAVPQDRTRSLPSFKSFSTDFGKQPAAFGSAFRPCPAPGRSACIRRPVITFGSAVIGPRQRRRRRTAGRRAAPFPCRSLSELSRVCRRARRRFGDHRHPVLIGTPSAQYHAEFDERLRLIGKRRRKGQDLVRRMIPEARSSRASSAVVTAKKSTPASRQSARRLRSVPWP